jgi:hypothetical protein
MGKTYDHIPPDLQQFIAAQKVFFVATAPLDGGGHVNLSPKGLDCFRVLSETRVAYLDLTGSGNETGAHVEENGRITFMFCAFDGPPNILRLYGRGRTVQPGSAEWAALAPTFPEFPGARQIVLADVHRVMTTCGFAVPFYDFRGDRDTLVRWAEGKGAEALDRYRKEKNARSIDGIPTTFAGQNGSGTD